MKKRIKFEYFSDYEAESFSFYRIPKVLFTDPYFAHVSCEAKVLYGVLLDRMSLSIRNEWIDRNGKVYIIFTIAELMEYMSCKRDKAIKLMGELDTVKGIGLIEKVKRGLGQADHIYVLNFNVSPNDSSSGKMSGIADGADIKVKEPEVGKDRPQEVGKDRPQEVGKRRPQEVGKRRPQGVGKCRPQEVGKRRPQGVGKDRPQEVDISDPNNTNINNTEKERSIHLSSEIERRMAVVNATAIAVKEQVGYEFLVCDHEKKAVDELTEIIVEVLASDKRNIKVSGEEIPAQLVKERFQKINFSHMQYVFACLEKNTSKVRNIKQYLISVLYNAPVTMSHFYQAEVNHDLYG
ncbi:replication initiator protein A [Ohessyouella blattaphilus]|uniref:Replication initiator protein A n=1 Tax=Ohessyouella blattaphilus TaxID=2949333 RepID=A0ABT1EM23_9FIRM|nr:replication initiator protein A [Ohessyouella blattaphilus]MCP1111576.1 replication initiator protein A [Ohessyouella blattaphilus]MCR8564970.1 replication initiator protein A [Ohessyouella blattaphilus]